MAAFVMSAVGAFYVLDKRHAEAGKLFLRVGVIAGLLSCIAQIFPTGDLHGRYVARYQPAAIAGMEGLFRTQTGAPIVLLGQPDMEQQRIDNPLAVKILFRGSVRHTSIDTVMAPEVLVQ